MSNALFISINIRIVILTKEESKTSIMEKVQAIKELLHTIQRTSGWPRMEAIRRIQTIILDEPDMPDEKIQQVFSDLAYDLNFYEDEPLDRDEKLGYYGDDKLIEVVDAAIKKIGEYEAGV